MQTNRTFPVFFLHVQVYNRDHVLRWKTIRKTDVLTKSKFNKTFLFTIHFLIESWTWTYCFDIFSRHREMGKICDFLDVCLQTLCTCTSKSLELKAVVAKCNKPCFNLIISPNSTFLSWTECDVHFHLIKHPDSQSTFFYLLNQSPTRLNTGTNQIYHRCQLFTQGL